MTHNAEIGIIPYVIYCGCVRDVGNEQYSGREQEHNRPNEPAERVLRGLG